MSYSTGSTCKWHVRGNHRARETPESRQDRTGQDRTGPVRSGRCRGDWEGPGRVEVVRW